MTNIAYQYIERKIIGGVKVLISIQSKTMPVKGTFEELTIFEI